jgi:ATP-binding cassette subfamily B protein
MKELIKLKKYVGRHKWKIMAGLLALILVDILQLFIPQVLKLTIDALAGGTATLSLIMTYGWWVIAIALGMGAGRFFWRYFIIGSARRIERELRQDFFSHLAFLDFSFFDEHKTGDLMAHATNDINAVRMALGFGMVILTDIVVLGIASLYMMFHISPRLSLYALIPLPFLSLVVAFFGQMIRKRFEQVQASFSELTERVRENISGIRVVKFFVQEEPEKQQFRESSRDYYAKNMKLVKVWGGFFPIMMFIASLSQGITFLAGGNLVIFGSVSLGEFVAFSAYLGILIWPMIAIGQAINVFQRGAASQGRLNRIFATRTEIADQPGCQRLERAQGRLEFKNVSFFHNGKSRPALKEISLKIEPQQLIGITGAIGSGKSTIVNLILRLYQHQSGKIFLDGRNISDYSMESLRGQVAFVPQDSFLFSDTIRENISFGRPEMKDFPELEKAARIAAIHEEISSFPRGYQTVVGERGVTLSGGQKQRVALARALLMDRPILILDDALSAVDADTERRILNQLSAEFSKRTAIVISHRIFAIQDADFVIVLEQGQIAEQGNHQELLALKGKYYEMYKLQQLERELATK